MTVRQVLRLGDPRLRQTSRDITNFGTPELLAMIADMQDTMAACEGAGLAAPQIGVMRRVMIFGFEKLSRYPDAEPVPETTLINPQFQALDDLYESGWEGCLSIPGMRGLVRRHARIRYRGFDPHGKLFEREADGFHARVFQHEYDHLDGVLYPDRLEDPLKFGFIEELQAAGEL